MGPRFSFCNDCDLMTRGGFEEVHGFLDELGIPAGDSFWLFDPSGGDMGLFTHDVAHPGPQHAWLLDHIQAGTIDVLHSTGSYGERFNRGYAPSRSQLAAALEYLAKHARVPRIWTNHGDQFNRQNIGGRLPQPHHRGDVPGDDAYGLDLLLEHGVSFFWLDRLIARTPADPFRVVERERCRDGREIVTFTRYLSPRIEWSPNAQNFSLQLDESEIAALAGNEQAAVFYTHWGAHHQDRYAYSPSGDVLTDDSRAALCRFASTVARTGARVVRLESLLDDLSREPIEDEVQRIAGRVVSEERDNPDQFYFNQYNKHTLHYFVDRVAGLEVSGRHALDAGCGVGQWSYALSKRFDRVSGIEINERAADHLRRITKAVHWSEGPRFVRGSIEQLPYADSSFDFVLCYGVLFCTNVRRATEEFGRVLAPHGRVFVSMNGDGWYESLCDVRFGDRPLDAVLPFAEPIWNALIARVGGEIVFDGLSRTHFPAADEAFWADSAAVRRAFADAFKSPRVDLGGLIRTYSDRVIRLLARLTRDRLNTRGPQPQRSALRLALDRVLRTAASTDTADFFPATGCGAANRAFLPDEFRDLVASLGLRMTAHGPDAALSRGRVAAIYEPSFNGHQSVWECLLIKAPS